MPLSDAEMSRLVDLVVRQLRADGTAAPPPGEHRKVQDLGAFRGVDAPPHANPGADRRRTYGEGYQARPPVYVRGRHGIFEDMDQAVSAARAAYERLNALDLETRERIVAAMRKVTVDHAEELAKMAVEETGLGRVADKVKKNVVAATKTPGIEILRPIAWTGDHGMAIHDRAPVGVIGSITPTTNPTETVINNGIGFVAGGNAGVFNVHPSAKNVCRHFIELLNDAIVSAGGPENLLSAIGTPTIESAQALMKHPGIRLIVVTGGPAVVKQAMASGKRAVAAGPGNPPVVVDETAHLEKAAKDIVAGASIDNNIICIVEKEIIAVASIADALKQELVRAGAYEVTGPAIQRLEKLVVTKDGYPNKDWVGKDAAKIARAAGLSVPESTRLLFAEVDQMHPFIQSELLMPVVGFVRHPTVHDCIAAAVQAEHGFGHTAVMHSTSLDNLHEMGRVINTSIYVKNGPSFAGLGIGGEGYTSWTIASPTGEGLTTALTFTRERRCTLKDYFRFV